MIGFGFFVANWVGYGCAFLRSSAQFRVPLGIQIVPALALFVGMFVLPYSPRWLAKQGRHEESRQTLVRLHGGRRTAKLDVIEAEFQEMLVQIEWEKENLATTPLDLMKGRPNIHRTLCGTLVQAMCQWTGVSAPLPCTGSSHSLEWWLMYRSTSRHTLDRPSTLPWALTTSASFSSTVSQVQSSRLCDGPY